MGTHHILQSSVIFLTNLVSVGPLIVNDCKLKFSKSDCVVQTSKPIIKEDDSKGAKV